MMSLCSIPQGASSCSSDEPAVHSLCLLAAHLGEVYTLMTHCPEIMFSVFNLIIVTFIDLYYVGGTAPSILVIVSRTTPTSKESGCGPRD